MVDLAKLAAPFPPIAVSWRIGSTNADKSRGMALAYLDARDVMERLDEVCGPDGWQATYPHAGQKTVCSIGILCGEHWVWKSNGAGDSDIEAEKGALSDAFKRAAVMWGVGRYLYSVPSPWVEIETKGRTSVIKDHEKARLATLLARHSGAQGSAQASPSPPAAPGPSSANGRRMAADEPHLIDQNRPKGKLTAVPSNVATQAGFGRPATADEARALKAKTWVDTAIGTLRLPGQSVESVDRWWQQQDQVPETSNYSPRGWLQEAAPKEYERLETAFNEIRDELKARVAA